MNSPAEIEIPRPTLTTFDGISKAQFRLLCSLSHSYLHSKSCANGATSRCFRSDWSISREDKFYPSEETKAMYPTRIDHRPASSN